VISHLHADHWTDLPLAIHTLRFAVERESPLPVYGPPGWIETMGIVAEWAREPDPVFSPHELREREALDLGGISVEPIRVEHSDLETYGLRIGDGAATVAYSADSGPTHALDALARDADLLICEAGAPEGEHSELHLTGGQAGEIAARAGVRRLLLTHLRPEADPDQAVAEARATFSGPVELATEGHSLGL
jgi:ribonuclease BN (tRNA processing enzyme)